MFGTPVLLKRKADQMMTNAPPPPPLVLSFILPSPGTSHLRLHRAHRVLDRVEQMVGVVVMAMLHQQGVMQEAASWQVKVEDVMREITKLLEENREQ